MFSLKLKHRISPNKVYKYLLYCVFPVIRINFAFLGDDYNLY